ncbi:hypothetical protein SDC9_81846 [bioreactor metagenome]|uniref:Uncharacterized protein n=1 Tax=bioreactor metagenome TaxID=1076179 RepID=A0A644Z320_9ZZZZ
MKKIILSIIAVVPLLAFAQNLPENFSVTLGSEYKNKYTFPGENSKAFELSDGGYAFIVPATYKGYACYRFDKNMGFISVSTILLSENDLGFSYNIEYFNDNIYLFLGSFDEKEHLFHIYAKTYNPLTGKLSEKTELFTIQSCNSSAELIERVIVSEDKSKVVIINRCSNCEKNPVMKLFCFDSQLSLLWSKDALAWDENDTYLDNFQIDNEGNVYQLHVVSSNIENKLYFTVYKAANDAGYSTNIELENKVYFNISFNVNETGGSVVLFYGNTRCSAQGVAFAAYDKDRDQLHEPIMTEFPSELNENEMVKGGSGGLFSYFFNNLLHLQNGNSIFIAEQQYDETIDYINEDVCKKEYSSGSTIKGYNRGAALVVIFSPKGDVLNVIKIPKIQQSYNSDHVGIFSFAVENDTYIIFNDNPENSEKNTKQPAVFASNDIYSNILIHIDEKGELSRFSFPENNASLLIPKLFRKLNNNELFYCGKKKTKFVAGKIKIQ